MTGDTQDNNELIQKAMARSGLGLLPPDVLERLSCFLSLLQHWNARLNLSAIRQPEQIIQRHLVESAFAARYVPQGTGTLLDFGTGAGFPGIPIAICRPEIQVTLAESQTKKVSFLREAVRVVGVNCEIFAERVEKMSRDRLFDVVTMRAVESMERAIPVANARANKCLFLLGTQRSADSFRAAAPTLQWAAPIPLPQSEQMILLMGKRS